MSAALLAALLLAFWTIAVLEFEEDKSASFESADGMSSVLLAQREADRLISKAVTLVLPVEVILSALLLTSGFGLVTRWRASLEKDRHWEYADQLERRIRATYDHITKLEQDLMVLAEAEKLTGPSRSGT